jgi:hypothetical protein
MIRRQGEDGKQKRLEEQYIVPNGRMNGELEYILKEAVMAKSSSCSEGLRKTTKGLRIAYASAEIRTDNVRNTSLGRCRCTILLSEGRNEDIKQRGGE